jgi:uroporphyrin-III C-methyltransferase/precorrin-2 dehydrogenase/sirohydrochlorin ferrochelatase
MGRSVAGNVAERLIDVGLACETPVAVIENATLPERRHFTGVLGDLAAIGTRTDITGPTLILIGRAAAEGALALAEPLAAARPLRERAA